MKREIEFNINSAQDQKLIKWFEKWGHRKWQYVLFHQAPIVLGWNLYWFFTDHNLAFYPLSGGAIAAAVIRELPILLAGILFWSIMKVREWNSYAFRVGVLNRKGNLLVEGSYRAHQIVEYSNYRMQSLSVWRNRWLNRKWLFLTIMTSFLFSLIILFIIGIKMYQKGNAWIDSFYPSEWPVYILLLGIPFVLALYVSIEIWRRNESDYRSSIEFQKIN